MKSVLSGIPLAQSKGVDLPRNTIPFEKIDPPKKDKIDEYEKLLDDKYMFGQLKKNYKDKGLRGILNDDSVSETDKKTMEGKEELKVEKEGSKT